MRIIFNTYATAFQCPGGGEIQLLRSKAALERRGHEVLLFDQWTHDLASADVIHQFSVQGGIYNLAYYARARGLPLVVSPILWLAQGPSDYPMQEVELMTTLADVICPNSLAELERFVEVFSAPREKYRVTHNGVDSLFFEDVAPAAFLSASGISGPFVLCVGNIEVRKNQLALLEATSRLGIHAVLVGNVRDRAYFSRLEEGFAGKFSYLGYLEPDSEMLRSAYAACSVFALPSLLETPGLAALEAAAAGAPLVVTQEGCTREYFGDGAYYVDPANVEDIADKIELAMSGAANRGLLRERMRDFTWDRVAEELEQSYSRAISVCGQRKDGLE